MGWRKYYHGFQVVHNLPDGTSQMTLVQLMPQNQPGGGGQSVAVPVQVSNADLSSLIQNKPALSQQIGGLVQQHAIQQFQQVNNGNQGNNPGNNVQGQQQGGSSSQPTFTALQNNGTQHGNQQHTTSQQQQMNQQQVNLANQLMNLQAGGGPAQGGGGSAQQQSGGSQQQLPTLNLTGGGGLPSNPAPSKDSKAGGDSSPSSFLPTLDFSKAGFGVSGTGVVNNAVLPHHQSSIPASSGLPLQTNPQQAVGAAQQQVHAGGGGGVGHQQVNGVVPQQPAGSSQFGTNNAGVNNGVGQHPPRSNPSMQPSDAQQAANNTSAADQGKKPVFQPVVQVRTKLSFFAQVAQILCIRPSACESECYTSYHCI